jgi:nitrogen fixation NifU-like protein
MVAVYPKLGDDQIADVSFESKGCSISTASASLMTELVMNKMLAELLKGSFHAKVPDTTIVDLALAPKTAAQAGSAHRHPG